MAGKQGSNAITIFNELELENYIMYEAGRLKISKENAVKLILLKRFKSSLIKDYSEERYNEIEESLLTRNTVKRDNNIKSENEKLKQKVKDLEAEIILQQKKHTKELQNAENYAKQVTVSERNTELKQTKYEDKKTTKERANQIEIKELLKARTDLINLLRNQIKSHKVTGHMVGDVYGNLNVGFAFPCLGHVILTKNQLQERFESDYDNEIKKLGGNVEPFDIDKLFEETGFSYKPEQENGDKVWIFKVKKS